MQAGLALIAAIAGGALVVAGLRHAAVAHRQDVRASVGVGMALGLVGTAGILFALMAVSSPTTALRLQRLVFALPALAGIVLHNAAGGSWWRTSADRIALAATAAALGWAIAFPVTVGGGGSTPQQLATWLAVVGGGVVVTMCAATTTLWHRTVELPEYARSRAHLLAASFVGLAAAILSGSTGFVTAGTRWELVGGGFVLVFVVPTIFGLLPPGPVRARLHRAATHELEVALDELSQHGDQKDFGAVLPHVADILGATEVELASVDGTVTHRHATPGERGAWRSVELHGGFLRLQIHPLAPLIGAREEALLVQVARDLDLAQLAIDRLDALNAARATQAELETTRERLKTINGALSEFGASVAHDLRTPLAIIQATMETLRKTEDLTDLGEDLLNRALQHTARATELVSGQLESAHRPDATETVALEHAVRWVEQTVHDELEQANARLTWRSPLPHVSGQEAVLRRVLLNLVRNAIQHGSRGAPLMIAIVPANDRSTVLVIDDGRGIPRSRWKAAFEQGTRLAGAAAGGHGLGLAGARTAMQRIGGDIEIVDSAPGAGTIFAVRLPVAGDGHGDQTVDLASAGDVTSTAGLGKRRRQADHA